MKHIIDDADKNKYEAYSKTEVLNVIQEAIATGQLPEELNGLVITLKNSIDNKGYKIAFCTQAKYNELEQAGTLEHDCYYFITDDTTVEDIFDSIGDVETDFNTFLNNLANQLNTKKININNNDGLIYGDNEGYLTIEGQNDIEFKYDNDKSILLSNIHKSIPVNVPIDSSNIKCDIENYGLGLYEVTVTKTESTNQYYYTGIISIIEEGVKSYVCHLPCGTSNQSIEWVSVMGGIGTILGRDVHEISILSGTGYTIAKCTRLIKY